MKKDQSLYEYHKKRDFTQTPEPSSEKPKKTGKHPIFVVQKHDASRLHYDFRLEIGDILVSWAVPKGPSTDPTEKRLAMRTEDHPLEYSDFEGVIPEGEYGAGTVIVWDTGTYRYLEGKHGTKPPIDKALNEGHITVWLEGKKLKGGYALTRMDSKGKWLMVKIRDDEADARRNPVNTQPESVLSGRTNDELAAESEHQNTGKYNYLSHSKRHTVDFSNTDKLFFPDEGITKGDFIEYYGRIADVMLPHLKDRPLNMHRFPDGIHGEGFYQQEIPDYFPEWIERTKVGKEGGNITHIICQDADTLLYLANQACITPHVWLSRTDRLNMPDLMVFDLDPPTDDFQPVRHVALLLRMFLKELDMESFVKTTGSKGLHVTVPLDRSADYEEVRDFAHSLAIILAEQESELVTTEQRKEKRRGRVFVDYLRNRYGQTVVAPYAVRARPSAPIAVPIEWEELKEKNLTSESYNIKNIFRRLAQKEDPWKEIWKKSYSVSATIQYLREIQKTVLK